MRVTATDRTGPRVCRVTVNGIDVTKECFAADDCAGTAECYRTANGRACCVRCMRGEVSTFTMRGVVRIEFVEDAPRR